MVYSIFGIEVRDRVRSPTDCAWNFAPHGIHTITVCPGYVNTRFQQNVLHGTPPPLAGPARKWAISPEKCAADIIRGIERGKRTVVTPASGWLLIALERLFPTLVDRQLERVYVQQVKQ